MSNFSSLLKEARERAGLTQAELARAIGLSAATIASWETGRRRPRLDERGRDGRQLVIEAADALGLGAAHLNEMLADLGLALVPAGRMVPLLDRRKSVAVIQAECAAYAWPTLAMNEDFEVVAWNDAANELSELDFGTDLAEPGARHLLRMALSDHYRDKLLNWDDVIAVMVAMWKVIVPDVLSFGSATPYFQNLMGYVFAHHGAEIDRLLRIWEETPPHTEGRRLEFNTDWRTSDGTLLHFHCQLTPWSDFDGTGAFDWHPADAATWDWLDKRRDARRPSSPPPVSEQPGRPTPSSARALLRLARERSGLSRRRLSELSGLSESLIYGIEVGNKSLRRETIVRIARAMSLVPTSLNGILDAGGFDPEPSELSAYLLGYEGVSAPRYASNVVRRTTSAPAAVAREIERRGWPLLVVNERCEVFAANRLAERAIGLDLSRLPAGPQRNLFAIVTDMPFRQAARNWETAVANVLPGNLEAYMAPPGGHRLPSKDADYFDSVVRYVRDREASAGRGDEVIHLLFNAWRANPTRRLTARVAFPLHCAMGGRLLSFNAVITPWNAMYDPYWAIDLHPADGETWRALE
ncbi:MAG: helix-turn-helix domain-containing protein [Chloroflexi bacterium]|nr:helix-turn-helix domain-containing protein [Chloroflexota bacterium]